MANKLLVKRSAVASKVPTTADLSLGEIAINTYDGKMYIKKDNGTASVVEVTGGGTFSGTLPISQGGTGKTTALEGITALDSWSFVTASATAVTMTSASPRNMLITGTGFQQTVLLPDTSTIPLGASYTFVCAHNWNLNLQTSTGTSITAYPGGTIVAYTCISTGVNTAAAWQAQLLGATYSTGSGAVVYQSSPNLTTPTLSGERFATSASLAAGANSQGSVTLDAFTSVFPITTTSANPSAVTLPSPGPGRRIVVANRATNPLNVYPGTGHYIDQLAINTPVSIPVNAALVFYGISSTQWTSLLNMVTDVSNAVNTLAVANGGTGAALTATNGGVVYSGASTLAITAAGTSGQALVSTGASAPAWSTLTLENLPDAWVKKSVRAATTANITLSGTQTIDGIAVVAGDRVLVKDQTTSSGNGIYVVSVTAWSRATDADTASEIAGGMVNVDSGTVNGGKKFSTSFKTTDTLGTTSMVWTEVAAGGGSGVSSVSFGSTGLTPSTATTGAITVAGTLTVANGGTGATTAPQGYSNLTGYTTTATAGGTTTLTAASSYLQFFTGTLAQTVVLPVTSTLALGWEYRIVNNSSGALTVQSSGLNTIATIPAGLGAIFTVILTTGTTAASWDFSYTDFGGVTGTGSNVLATSPALVTPDIGTPSAGTLSNCTVDGTNSVGFRNVPQNSQSAAYTLVLADAGKHIYHPSTDATARTFTIPANASVAYPIGTAITFVNMSTGAVTIAITTDTMYLSGAGTTGSRTLAQYGTATALKLTATTWIISGTNLT